MTQIIKLKRGLKANLPTEAAIGEPILCTDTGEFYLGLGAGQALKKISNNAEFLNGKSDSYFQKAIAVSVVAPSSPELHDLWLDISTTPITFKLYDGVEFVEIGNTSVIATEVTFTPDGDLASTNVQDAIVELRNDVDTKLSTKVDTTTLNTEVENINSIIDALTIEDLADVNPLIAGAGLKRSEDGTKVESFLTDITPSYVPGLLTGGIVTSSSHDGVHVADNAFDHDSTDFFGAIDLPSISYTFEGEQAHKVYKYTVKAPVSAEYLAPLSIKLEGALDPEGTYTLVDTQSSLSWTSGEKKEFTLSTPAEYAVFRLTVLTKSGDKVGIDKIELIGDGLKYLLEEKADRTYTESLVQDLQTQVDSANDAKADKTYVDQQDQALQTQITTLSTDKLDITAFNTEVSDIRSDFATADTALQGQIDTLSTASSTLDDKIDQEITDRTTADTALQDQITDLSTNKADITFVNSVIQGLQPKAAVRVATTENLSVTASGSKVGKTLTAASNGALVVDGVVLAVSDRVLVKDQTNAVDNGIYSVTATGDASNPYVLTRAVSEDGDPDVEVASGCYFFVKDGTLSTNCSYVITKPASGLVDVDVSEVNFTQMKGVDQIIAGNGLSRNANELSVNVDNTTIEITTDTLQIKNVPANLVGNGDVDNTELSYLNGVTSNIQTQLDDEATTRSNAVTGLQNDLSTLSTTVTNNNNARISDISGLETRVTALETVIDGGTF